MDINIINYECYKCKNNFPVEKIVIEVIEKDNFGKYICVECKHPIKKPLTWYEYFRSFIY